MLSVGTLNVWGRWADWPARLEVLREQWPHPGPDVLMLQEVIEDAAGDQAQEVAAALGYPEWVSIEGHRFAGAREGVAMLSRRPLHDAREEELPVSDPARRILLAEVEVEGSRVSLACGHTVAGPEHVRLEQVHALLARLEDPLVLGADLNETPATVGPLLEVLGLVDALDRNTAPTWPMCHVTFGAAWEAQLGRAPHFSLERRRLDYLLARGMEVVGASVHDLRSEEGVHASDHALVIGEFAPSNMWPGSRSNA
jgi:endonuclease/exonuclease/phosphatase family metal-dependent hydrolase